MRRKRHPVKLLLPSHATLVFSALQYNPALIDLREDLVSIRLNNNKTLDVSWKPEFDPAGKYIITVSTETSLIPLIQLSASTTEQAVSLIDEIVDMFEVELNTIK